MFKNLLNFYMFKNLLNILGCVKKNLLNMNYNLKEEK